MGKREFVHRESKKPKKGTKKAHTLLELEQAAAVEVIKKRKDKEEE
jgi:hypothetical protein